MPYEAYLLVLLCSLGTVWSLGNGVAVTPGKLYEVIYVLR